jgi:Outer membrane protein beta-barrel domain
MSRSSRAVAVFTVVAVFATTAVAAQTRARMRFGVGAGVSAPQGDFHADAIAEGFKTGWAGVAFVEFKAPERPMGLRVDLAFGGNAANDQLNADVSAFIGQPATSKARTVGANVDLVYYLGRARRGGGGYVLGGIGSYQVSLAVSSGGVTADTSETKFAWNAGGGLTFPVGRTAMFVEARYVNISSTFFLSGKAQLVAVTAGFRFGR